jgi:S-DNA-T family DNA segregation ATPase FtsK/SpoIIIE
MSIDETDVQPVNGVAHKRVRIVDTAADGFYDQDTQPTDQPQQARVSATVDTPAETGHDDTEPIEGEVINRPSDKARTRLGVRTSVHSWWLRSKVFKTIVRELVYVGLGAGVFWRRLMDAHTTSLHRREIRTAEAAGDRAAIAEWEEKARKHKQEVHDRHMARLKAPLHFAQAIAIGAPALAGFLFLLGVALAVYQRNGRDVLKPLFTAFGVVSDITEFLMVVVPLAVIFSPAIAFVSFLALGHAKSVAPEWIAPEQEQPASLEVVPDENAILKALRNLGWRPMNQAVKAGWQPRWIQPPARIANGWVAQLQLPMGCTVEQLTTPKLKNVFAHNLVRMPVEVWPTEPDPTIMDLFVADQGSLTRPIGPWPWLTDLDSVRGDFWKGVPIAQSQRGEVIWGQLMAKNYIAGGIMGSGKSSIIKTLLLGALLDPLVEAEVYVMAQNVDYDPMRPVLKRLVKGDDDEEMAEALKALRHIVSDVTYRGRILEELGGEETKLTREIAERDPRMRPKVVIFDECHELFEHKEFGEEAGELAIKAMKKARKVGIVLVFVTVSPTAKSIPKDLSRNTSNRVAFAVGDHIANDGLLGSGKFKAGIRATNLNPATDIGTAVTIGFTENTFELVRTYNVVKEKGRDEVTPIVERIQKLREELAAGGIQVGGIEPPAPPEQRDLLADVLTVLKDAPAAAASVAAWLKQLAPDWAAYRGLVGVGDKDAPSSLVFQLGLLGAVVPSTGNKWIISPELIRAAMNRRRAESDDAPEDFDAS